MSADRMFRGGAEPAGAVAGEDADGAITIGGRDLEPTVTVEVPAVTATAARSG